MIFIHQLKAGGALLLDARWAFTTAELTTYNNFVTLTITINALTLEQADLKE
jgi:26S proteasome regulatory subunit N7